MNITMGIKNIRHLDKITSNFSHFLAFLIFSRAIVKLSILFFSGYRYAHEYYKKGGYLCPSDIYYGRPKRAINTYGKWKVIVNLPDEYYAKGYGKGYEKYTQTQRLEQCMYPSAPCSFVDKKYYSECLQKHNFVRLLSYTYEEGLHIDSFKMPIACSCHISEPHHYA